VLLVSTWRRTWIAASTCADAVASRRASNSVSWSTYAAVLEVVETEADARQAGQHAARSWLAQERDRDTAVRIRR
jgi:hypothetical protein